MSAISAVLDTNELLEMILLQLPMRITLMNRAVCRHWYTHIESSLQLGRATFREPDGNGFLLVDKAQGQTGVITWFTTLLPSQYFICPVLSNLKHAPKFRGMEHHIFYIRTEHLLVIAEDRSYAKLRSLHLTQPPYTAISLGLDKVNSRGDWIAVREE